MEKKTHKLKTWAPYFQDIIDGKKPFNIRPNDRNFEVGDNIIHTEWNTEEQKETGRQCWTTITYVLKGGLFGIPETHCIFAQHTLAQTDFIRDFAGMEKVLKEYEDKLSSRWGGNISERLNYVLRHFNEAATGAVWKGKNFLDDVKTQFKAFEIILEGLTSEAYNHGQKRVIANHLINMIRSNIDRLDQVQWDYSNRLFENYNYFRSDSPEGDLMKRYRNLIAENKDLKARLGEKDNNPSSEQHTIDPLPF